MKKKLTGVALVLAAVSLMGHYSRRKHVRVPYIWDRTEWWSLVARWTGKKIS